MIYIKAKRAKRNYKSNIPIEPKTVDQRNSRFFMGREEVLTMAKEFIERGALIARYDAEHVGSPGRARELMATAPAADVVEVVRCKDCNGTQS